MLRGEVEAVDARRRRYSLSPHCGERVGVRGPRRMRSAKVTNHDVWQGNCGKTRLRAEQKLWRYLRSRSLGWIQICASGADRAVMSSILFVERNGSSIEVDGGQHAENRRRRRRAIDGSRSIATVSCASGTMKCLENIEGVWDTIFAAASAATPPHPDPLPARGERELPSRDAAVKLHIPRLRPTCKRDRRVGSRTRRMRIKRTLRNGH